ncbi:MAG: hypothetical protein OXF52_03265 [Candidatus Dadabacteria bacterium]|nr:hypothetical protein [Candidatus Dadabacteria bacterium]
MSELQSDENISGQYARAREGLAVFDISGRGRLSLSGRDTLKFLQGILTNDVLKPAEGEGLYTLMLNRKGRVLTDMRLFKGDGVVIADLESCALAPTAQRLNEFKLSYKVAVEEKGGFSLLYLCGPEAAGAVSRLCGADAGRMKPFDHFEGEVAGAKITAARTDRAGAAGFDLACSSADADAVLAALRAEGAGVCDPQVLEIMRVEEGVALYGRDMDENVIAPETGLLGAVSFEKGCYVGQEIVARAHWRGKVNRLLARLEFDGAPPPEGAELFSESGDRAGRITSSALSPRLGAVAMGYVRREFSEPQTGVRTDSGRDGRVAGAARDGFNQCLQG